MRPFLLALLAGMAIVGLVEPVALLPGQAQAQLPSSLPGPGGAGLEWGPCPVGEGSLAERSAPAMECATFSVPLDHARPGEEQIPLRVWRLRAAGPGPSLGALVLIDGAPGSSDALPLASMARAMAPGLRSRFDLVSWQRRGTGRRGEPAALHCWPSAQEAEAWRNRLPPSLPVGETEQSRWLESWGELARACQRHQSRLLPHLSSADSARDLELLRLALGEKTLRLRASGVATLIGATYANLYPTTLGALVLDGAADPFAWGDNGNPRAVEGTGLRLEQDLGSGATLIAFLRRCAAAGRARCPFAPGSPGASAAATERRYAELLARLRQGPLRWGDRRLGSGEVFSELRQRLQTVPADRQGQGGWEGVGAFLDALSRGGSREARGEVPREEAPEQALALLCSETPNPRERPAIQAAAEQASSRSGPLGPWVAWGDARCAAWPAAAAPYNGPWMTPTPVAALVIGHRFDPVLPFQSSLSMARELEKGLLLSVNGYGHTVLRNPSACVARYETAYFLSGLLPPLGTVCSPDADPFAPRP